MDFDSASVEKDLSRFLQNQPSTFLARFLPFSVYRKYISLMGFYYYGKHREKRRALSQSMQFVLGNNNGWLAFRMKLFRTYLGIFEHYFEKMVNAHRPLEMMMNHLNNTIQFTGKKVLDDILAENSGCILVTGHFGAVEYIPLFLAANGYRPSMILRYKTKRLKETLVEKSNHVDLQLIDAEAPNALFKGLQAIRSGRVLITLCDEVHNWKPCSEINASIFGRSIPKDRTLDILSERSKAALCFGIIQREKASYALEIQPLEREADSFSACKASWKLLETYVYRYPEQWYQWPSFYPEFTKYISDLGCYDHS
ncbi:MAG: hypothetical protein QNJ22_14680 [Desulfosarcinaceae bacterium]|nr:hypothetical protein [Desulfosarcinaceae bacterium]